MIVLKWFLAICTSALLIGCSVMILMCLWQIFSEVIIEPFKAIKHRMSSHDNPLAPNK